MQLIHSDVSRVEIASADELFSLDRAEVQKQLEINRALHITGASVKLEEFLRFSDAFISVFQADPSSFGNRPTLIENASTYEAVKGTEFVIPHGELYSLPSPPDYIILYCGQPADQGGETTIYDGAKVARQLSAEAREEFEKSPVVYTHRWGRPQWQHFFGTKDFADALRCLQSFAQVTVRESSEERLVFDFETFAINSRQCFVNGVANILSRKAQGINEVTFRGERAISPKLLQEIGAATSRCETRIEWRKGDILLLDNHRMMHGRRAFSGQRKVAVRFGKRRP